MYKDDEDGDVVVVGSVSHRRLLLDETEQLLSFLLLLQFLLLHIDLLWTMMLLTEVRCSSMMKDLGWRGISVYSTVFLVIDGKVLREVLVVW